MILKLLRESLKGWSIVAVLLFIVIILSLINKTLGAWSGSAVGILIIIFFILGILSILHGIFKKFKK